MLVTEPKLMRPITFLDTTSGNSIKITFYYEQNGTPRLAIDAPKAVKIDIGNKESNHGNSKKTRQ